MLAILMTSPHDWVSWPFPQTDKDVDIGGSGGEKTSCGARLPFVGKFLFLSESINVIVKTVMKHEDTSGTYFVVLLWRSKPWLYLVKSEEQESYPSIWFEANCFIGRQNHAIFFVWKKFLSYPLQLPAYHILYFYRKIYIFCPPPYKFPYLRLYRHANVKWLGT